MIHWISLFDASRSLISEGMATLRIVLSMTMISSERHSTPSVHHRLACTRSSCACSISVVVATPRSCLYETEPSSIVIRWRRAASRRSV